MELTDKEYKNLSSIDGPVKVKEKKNFVVLVKQYSVPLISLTLFLSIIVIFIYPVVNNIYNNYKLTEKATIEEVKLKTDTAALEKLRQNDTQTIADLETLDRIVPSEKTKIVNLQQFIDEKVKEYNLSLESISISEELKKVSGDEAEIISTKTNKNDNTQNLDEFGKPKRLTEDSLRVAPTTAEISGKFSDISKFFSDFYKIKDLFIIEDMSLTVSDEVKPSEIMTSAKTWELAITFAKYAFSEDFLIDESTFSQIPASSQPDSSVLEYMRARFTE